MKKAKEEKSFLPKKKSISKKPKGCSIWLDPEKLKQPQRIKKAKLKIIKEIATTEDLTKLKELNQFNEDKVFTNECDVSVKEAIEDALHTGLEIGKREGLHDGYLITEIKHKKEQSEKQKERGLKRKIWNGRTPEEREKRDQNIIEQFKNTKLTMNGFAIKYHNKFKLETSQIRNIIRPKNK